MTTRLAVTIAGHAHAVELNWTPQSGNKVMVWVDGQPLEVIVPTFDTPTDAAEWLIVDGRPLELVSDPDLHWLRVFSGLYAVDVRDTQAAVTRPRSGDPRVKAPIPGLVTHILVEPGQRVAVGDPVAVLEAMKMENEIHATTDGSVRSVHVRPGQTVLRGEVLLEIG